MPIHSHPAAGVPPFSMQNTPPTANPHNVSGPMDCADIIAEHFVFDVNRLRRKTIYFRCPSESLISGANSSLVPVVKFHHDESFENGLLVAVFVSR
ncbi:hypothetical protein CDAR_502991 [Caerostris darwini]|uniref:Uncharacterized protein n=1 Tax=Caerostris darwini TaxID=1538125 RepID=A0AAV4SZL2_9ARAC|nr:hypothetical protein CDAR_502991 [Caerostris darwini]